MTDSDARAFPSSRSRTVGVIGLGIMGGAIAKNLVASGWQVLGFDPDGARAEEASAAGVTVFDTVAEIASRSAFLLTSLPSAAALEATAEALVAARPAEAVIVAELSTLPLAAKEACRKRLAESGVMLLDCPLSGTGAQAINRDLVVYASGDVAVFERCRELFAGFSRLSYFLGAFGNGTKMKFVANLLVHVHNVAAGEAIALGLRAGLDPATLCEIAGSGAGGSRVLELRGPMMVAGRYEPATMKLEVWQKDMKLIGDFIAETGTFTPLFDAATPVYEAAITGGRGREDTAAVCAVLQEKSRQAR